MTQLDLDLGGDAYPDPAIDGLPVVHRLAIHLIRLLRAAHDLDDPLLIEMLRPAGMAIGRALAHDLMQPEENGTTE